MVVKKVICSIVCLLLYFSITCLADEVEIEDCGSDSGSIIKVEIAGCENQNRCPLKRDLNATLTAKFKSSVESKTLKAVVHGKVGAVRSPFFLPNSNACESGVVCPLHPGDINTYTVSMFVKPNYPRVTVDIEIKLVDDNNKSVICAIIPSKIVPKPTAK